MKKDVSFHDLIVIGNLLSAQEQIIGVCKEKHLTYGEPSTIYLKSVEAFNSLQCVLIEIIKEEKTDE